MESKILWKKIVGIVFVILGILALVTPLTPGSWLVIVGLELLGIRFLFLDKLKALLKDENKKMKIKRKLVSPVLMWLIVISGIVLVFQIVPGRMVFPRGFFSWLILICGISYWTYFFLGAIMVHRKAPLSAEKIDKLIMEGVYGKVRHPIYGADIVLGWSVFFFYPDVRLLLGAHLLMFVLLFWMRLEEKALIEKFGAQYLDYKNKVPKMFPKL